MKYIVVIIILFGANFRLLSSVNTKSILFCIVELNNKKILTEDIQQFYITLSGDNIFEINKLISDIDNSEKSIRLNAYKAALLMKKASILRKPAEKLQSFKKGRKILELEIKNDSLNIELRFLRLIIQENSPEILKYKQSINSDSKFIVRNINKTTEPLKNIIINYAKKSKSIKFKH